MHEYIIILTLHNYDQWVLEELQCNYIFLVISTVN